MKQLIFSASMLFIASCASVNECVKCTYPPTGEKQQICADDFGTFAPAQLDTYENQMKQAGWRCTRN